MRSHASEAWAAMGVPGRRRPCGRAAPARPTSVALIVVAVDGDAAGADARRVRLAALEAPPQHPVEAGRRNAIRVGKVEPGGHLRPVLRGVPGFDDRAARVLDPE